MWFIPIARGSSVCCFYSIHICFLCNSIKSLCRYAKGTSRCPMPECYGSAASCDHKWKHRGSPANSRIQAVSRDFRLSVAYSERVYRPSLVSYSTKFCTECLLWCKHAKPNRDIPQQTGISLEVVQSGYSYILQKFKWIVSAAKLAYRPPLCVFSTL